MKTIEYQYHIADLRVRIEADTLEELFEAALKGMSHILKKDLCAKTTEFSIDYEVNIDSKEINSLLADFLSSILTKSLDEKILFCELGVSDFSRESISATIYGNKVDEFDKSIKSITYFESGVQQNNRGYWETQLIFEV